MDTSACAKASCATTAELFVLEGKDAASACILDQLAVSPSGEPSVYSPKIRGGDSLVFVLTTRCKSGCADCSAISTVTDASDQREVALSLQPAKPCVRAGSLPPGVGGCGGRRDAGAERDLPWTPDLRPTPDRGFDTSVKLSCGEAMTCSKTCTTLNCVIACLARLCPSGVPIGQRVLTCAQSKCLSCFSNFAKLCESCITSKCSSESAACMAHQC